MALKVPCGVSGKVRVVLTDSQSGDVTHDTGEFQNIWTDIGLDYLSEVNKSHNEWPDRLLYGSGEHSQPHNAVTAMKSYLGVGSLLFGNAVLSDLTITPETCTYTKTQSITVAARGVAWTLRELGLSSRYDINKALTYTPTKNLLGTPTPIPVSAIEIVTIYYTIQVSYPMELPPQPVIVEGLPPTMATFKLKPIGSAGTSGFLSAGAINTDSRTSRDVGSYTNESFAGRIGPSTVSGRKVIYDIGTANRVNEYFGVSTGSGANHIWKVDPPITKNNTQVLELEFFWQFTNVTPIEV